MSRTHLATFRPRTRESAVVTTIDTSVTDSRAIEHAAVLYADLDDFVVQVGSFVRAGLDRDDAVLVATDAARIDALRDVLPSAGRSATFVDSTTLVPNPARLLPMWKEFVDDAARAGRGVTGVGEPAVPARTIDEYGELARNEALVEAMFADTTACSILCPYDLTAVPSHVVDDVVRTHRVVHGHVPAVTSTATFDADAAARHLDEPLPPPPTSADVTRFTSDDYALIRARVAQLCARDRLDEDRTDDLVLAVHELATNSTIHGGGTGTMTSWTTDSSVVVEIASAGRFTDPSAGRVRPGLVREHGRGLWLVNQLCDLVQLRNTPTGNAVRVRIHLR
jgi:anti-sigma regulatory factor (Ser/Thr protein kinase)